jgi:GntR family transcriptional repressor for pyruvate dehydrogenase complex
MFVQMSEPAKTAAVSPGYGQLITTSLAGQIASALEQAIVEGRLRIDEQLPTEDQLARQFGVSRPTVREALKRLAAKHLVRSRRGPAGGTFVTGPSPDQLAQSFCTAATLMVAAGGVGLDDMAIARTELEAICCRLAAANRTDAHLETMREEIATQRRPATSDQDFCASDVRFHRAIADAAGNPIIGLIMHVVIEGLMPVSNLIIFRVRERRTVVRQHERITSALEARDPVEAVSALGELTRTIRDQYARAERARADRATINHAP